MVRQCIRGLNGRSAGMLRVTTLGVLAAVALLATVASAQAGGELSGGEEDAECPLGEEAGSMAVGQRGLELVKVCARLSFLLRVFGSIQSSCSSSLLLSSLELGDAQVYGP